MSENKGLEAWLPERNGGEEFFGLDRSISSEDRAEIQKAADQIVDAIRACLERGTQDREVQK